MHKGDYFLVNMRIAQITPVYPPYRGGMGNVAYDYVEALKQEGHEVQVFAPSTIKPVFSWGNAAFIPQLMWRLRGFDVIHLHYPFYGSAIATCIAAFFTKTPIVMTYHMKTVASGWLGLIFKLYRFFVEPFLLASMNQILISSVDYANSIGIAGEKVIDFPFLIDTEKYAPGESDIRQTLNISSDEKVILFVGGMDDAHYFKGIDVLMHAFAKAKNGHLILVGDGNLRSGYERLANDLEIENRVHFAGNVDSLIDFYRAADLHVLPSVNQAEAFGLVTLEAASSGLPSIVSNLPGVRTLVQDGVTGWIVEPGSMSDLERCIEVALSSDLKKMGEAARRRAVDVYSESDLGKKLTKIYESL